MATYVRSGLVVHVLVELIGPVMVGSASGVLVLIQRAEHPIVPWTAGVSRYDSFP